MFKVLAWSVVNFKETFLAIRNAMFSKRGFDYSSGWSIKACSGNESDVIDTSPNRLKAFFDANVEGNGVWKFEHYFDIYERHFAKFVGKEAHIVEVGIYSGGSLRMWQDYFGEKCKIYGIDIQEECMAYEDSNVKIFIGDQESRDFWRTFKQKVPHVDILIDDGGHLVEQQIATLEEILPHLRPGGVYLCEDVSGSRNKLTAYVNGLQNYINSINQGPEKENLIKSKANGFQQQINSIHQYPYAFVIEKRENLVNELVAPKHGTIWGSFYKAVEK